MADKYLELVNSGFTKNLAKTLGLPRPSILRRYAPGAPLVPGPVLLLGNSPQAQELSDVLLGWGLDVRRHAVGEGKVGAIVLLLDAVATPGQLSEPMLAAGHALRQLTPGGRVVSFSRPALATDTPAVAAARQGIDGSVRSLGRELRGGPPPTAWCSASASMPRHPLRLLPCVSCFRGAAPTLTGSSCRWIRPPEPSRRILRGRWPARSPW